MVDGTPIPAASQPSVRISVDQQKKRRRCKSHIAAALHAAAPGAWEQSANWLCWCCEIREKQLNDADIGLVLIWAESGCRPEWA